MTDALHGEFILNNNPAKESSAEKESVSEIKRKTPHFFTAFGLNPEGLTFAEQEEGEEILLLLRRHFVTNVPWIVTTIFFGLLPLVFPLLLSSVPFPIPSPSVLMLMLAFYYLILFGFVLLQFTLWYFHIGLVTNIRVIDIDLAGILYRRVAEAKFGNIQDVTYHQVGFIASLFNYGDVSVQTAGQAEDIEFDRVPRPSRIADIIGDLINPT